MGDHIFRQEDPLMSPSLSSHLGLRFSSQKGISREWNSILVKQIGLFVYFVLNSIVKIVLMNIRKR